MALIANPRVVDIREQRRIEYKREGRTLRYTCDLVVTWESGLRVAYEVKYAEDVVRQGTDALLVDVAARCDDTVADEFRILTETDLDLVTIQNGAFVIECAKDQDRLAMEAVGRWLTLAPDVVTLTDVDIGTGLGLRARRAAVALIQTGMLAVPTGEIICEQLGLTNRVAHQRAA